MLNSKILKKLSYKVKKSEILSYNQITDKILFIFQLIS